MKTLLIYIAVFTLLFLFSHCNPHSQNSETFGEEAKSYPDSTWADTIINIGIPPEARPHLKSPSEIALPQKSSDSKNTSSPKIVGSKEAIPYFPWPPPRPSSFTEIPKKYFSTCIDFHDVNEKLTIAMDMCGYNEKSYYKIPNGFAIVSRIEQINSDATSKKPPARWSVEPEVYSEFSLVNYLKAVFYANPGLFRVFTIIVSDQPFSASKRSISEDEATKLLNEGLNTLPNELGEILKSKDTYCTLLVYEFEKPENQDTSFVVLPGKHIGVTHLSMSLIMSNLELISESTE